MSQIIATPQQLTELRDRVRAEQAAQKAAGHKQVRICMGAGCIASGAEQVKQSIEAELQRSGVQRRRVGHRHRLPGPLFRRPDAHDRRRLL